MQECEEPSPPCEFSWYATQWSECSSKCADMMGLQTRLEDDDEVDDVDQDDDVDEKDYGDDHTGRWW